MRILRASCLRSITATVSVASVLVVASFPAAFANPSVAHVKVEATNLRSGPGVRHRTLAVLHPGRSARVLGRSGDWVRVRLATGTTGWVKAGLLTISRASAAKPAPPAAEPAAAETAATPPKPPRGGRIVRTALSYRGTPYRFGARGTSAFDCSGFTSYLFAKAGSPLPRTAAAQYKKGVPVPKAEMRPGDLVFFKNTYKRGISHVGVYIGDDKFVHASSGGGGVRVDSLGQPYYAKKWAGARRPK